MYVGGLLTALAFTAEVGYKTHEEIQIHGWRNYPASWKALMASCVVADLFMLGLFLWMDSVQVLEQSRFLRVGICLLLLWVGLIGNMAATYKTANQEYDERRRQDEIDQRERELNSLAASSDKEVCQLV